MMAAIDIHKRVLQSAVLDPASGEFAEERFSGREGLADWATRWRGRVATVVIEATTGWRWVARELEVAGFEVRLADPGQAKALRGRKRKAKTDRLDARWLCLLLARELLAEAEAWLAPAEIQELRDKTRLRKALVDDRTRWAQRLHALLTQEGWPCERARLLTATGRRWVEGLALPPASRAHVELIVRLIEQLEREAESLAAELRRFAKSDPRCQRLTAIFGVGPIIACTCSPRSARRAASAGPARSCAWPASTRSSPSPQTASGAASWPRPARPRSAGRSCRPPSTPAASAAPTAPSTGRPPPAAARSGRS